MFELTVEMPFSAAHRICGHAGACANLHGHNYRALIGVMGEGLNELGMLVDFGELKELCAEIVAPLDHGYLNETPGLADPNPTAEVIARHIYQELARRLKEKGVGVSVSRVTVFESERSSASYQE